MLLAIGGENNTQKLASVELFDLTKPGDGWRSAAPMPTGKRSRFAAAVLNNLVYVCGGYGDASTKSCIAYDPISDSWNTSIARTLDKRENSALAAHQGSLYAVGGRSLGSSTSVERYNVTTNRWSWLSNFPVQVEWHAMASLGDYLYVAGGLNRKDYSPYASLYRYDSELDSWRRLPDMPTARSQLALVAVQTELDGDEGFLYAIGGHDGFTMLYNLVERFNVAANRWKTDFPGSSLTVGLYQKRAIPLISLRDTIVVVGGDTIEGDRISNVMQTLNVSSSASNWTVSSHAMREPRWNNALVSVQLLISN